MTSARIAVVLFLAACGGKSTTPISPTGNGGMTEAKGVDAPAVSASGVVAMDESALPVLVLIDAKGQRSIAAAASWKDVSAAKWSAGPKQAGDSASYMSIREGTLLGKDPKSIVDEFTDYRTGMDDDRTTGGEMDDPPPPEEEDKPDDGEDESGGTGTAISLDEGKMGKKDSDRAEGQYKMQKNQEDPQLARQQAIDAARSAGILGQTGTGQRGRVWVSNKKDEAVRQAVVQGEVTKEKMVEVPAVVIPHPSAKAAAVVKVVGELTAMIGVRSGNEIRPLHIQFHSGRNGGVSPRQHWLEVRVESNGLTIEAVPSKSSVVTWAEASGKLKGALAEARDRKKWNEVPVDVLVSNDVDAQHLVDVLVAIDAAGVTEIGLGLAPIGEQLTLRGKDAAPKPNRAAVPTVSVGQPNAQGDLDKEIIRRYVKRNIQKIQYCYEKELLSKPGLKGTVQVQFFIKPDGKVQTASGSGVDPNVANCVAQVIKDIEFPKPKGGGGVQVNYPFTFAQGK